MSQKIDNGSALLRLLSYIDNQWGVGSLNGYTNHQSLVHVLLLASGRHVAAPFCSSLFLHSDHVVVIIMD